MARDEESFRILLVEDNPADAELMRDMLARAGGARWHVEWADRLARGIDLVKERTFDAVLLDLGLSDSEGVAAIGRLRALAPTLPIVVLTGFDDEETALVALRHGAQDYLVKSRLDSDAVARTLRYARERARAAHERQKLVDERDRLLSELSQFFKLSLEMLCIAGFDGYFKELNSAWTRTLGFSLAELKAVPFLEFVHPDDLVSTTQEAEKLRAGGETVSFECRYRRKDGFYRWLVWTAAVSVEQELYYAAARDVTEGKEREQELMRAVVHDPLTGLPNRVQILDRLERLLARAKGSSERVAVLFIDVDSFKSVNDTLGHAAGDDYLIMLARRVERCLRPGDILGRLAGDEFSVLLDHVTDGVQALEIAERIQRELASAPFRLGGREVVGSASIGVALSTAASEGPGDLIRNSDAAMYQAKGAGRGRCILWCPE